MIPGQDQQTAGIIEGPPADDNDRAVRKEGWRNFFNELNSAMQDPVKGAIIFRLGTELMKDHAPGQSTSDFLGRAMQNAQAEGAQTRSTMVQEASAADERAIRREGLDVQRRGQDIGAETTVRGQDISKEIATDDRQLRRETMLANNELQWDLGTLLESGRNRRHLSQQGHERGMQASQQAFQAEQGTQDRGAAFDRLRASIESQKEIAQMREESATARTTRGQDLNALVSLIEMNQAEDLAIQRIEQADRHFDENQKLQYEQLTQQIHAQRDRLWWDQQQAARDREAAEKLYELERRRLTLLEEASGEKLNIELYKMAFELEGEAAFREDRAPSAEGVEMRYWGLKAAQQGQAEPGSVDQEVERLISGVQSGYLSRDRAIEVARQNNASPEAIARLEALDKQTEESGGFFSFLGSDDEADAAAESASPTPASQEEKPKGKLRTLSSRLQEMRGQLRDLMTSSVGEAIVETDVGSGNIKGLMRGMEQLEAKQRRELEAMREELNLMQKSKDLTDNDKKLLERLLKSVEKNLDDE